ncbi:MAG TPA: CDGSH iron-sulfur domain-containing protein [Steroidobacteraceae bacterium]|jgi:CDGSH-type Zn-finger protein|nr:CDGSH iron-sulfur domain-containing protein [Steroidobacteraceae bacterium]
MSKSRAEPRVTVTKNGPYLVSGAVPLARQTIVADAEGGSEEWRESHAFPPQESYALCRCGHSKTKPFCDGSHSKVGFDGTESASREPYRQQAELMEGPEHALSDAQPLCAFARFCDPHGQVWNQVEHTDEPQVRATFVRQVGECPSGRLVASERRTGKALEPALPVSIGVIEDPPEGVSGGLWLRGGIPVIAADGFSYEVRNRVTLCRCGASKNKPFCDGSHAAIKFRDPALGK